MNHKEVMQLLRSPRNGAQEVALPEPMDISATCGLPRDDYASLIAALIVACEAAARTCAPRGW
jgi:hypothetical protein